MVESARHLGLLSASAIARLVPAVSPARRKHLREAAGASESGGESLLRFELLTRRIRHAQQVLIQRVGRVDFVIGDGLVIEADGAEFHTDRASFEDDRRRDAILAALGFRVLRFSYTQIRERPDEVWAAIGAALARGDHWRTTD
jgi:very-short-patch-repair endonuclease